MTNSIGIELVYIPAGEFMMGSTDADIKAVEAECKLSASNCTYNTTDEGPVRRVAIREGFWMGKYEVTQGQWRSLMGDNPSYFKQCGDNCPVETVSWEDAKRFIGKLNEKNDGFVYALPTEAEWEYAARAGTTGIRYGSLDDVAWYADNAGNRRINSIQMWFGDRNWDNYIKSVIANGNRARPVGGKAPNAWGLYDMLGNVLEWVEDIYKSDGYGGLPTDGSANVTRGDRDKRVLRGGSWVSDGSYSRSASRPGGSPTVRDSGSGFRVVARPR
jgi:formylglycine-generating enzyme required for sulfatase activity